MDAPFQTVDRSAPVPPVADRLEPYLADLDRPVGEAVGLPSWIYFDPAVFEAERKTIFSKVWIGIAYESDVAEPGDVATADYAGWRFIVTRAEDGEVRVFYNLCRHRGMAVLDGPRHQQRTLSCPWHMWSYDLKGRLIGTPNIGGTGVHTTPGIERGELGLVPVRTGRWMGVIFVNIDGKAPPLAEYLKPTTDRLRAFDLSLARESDERFETRFAGNWKLAIEGGVEDYHIPFVHKQLGPSGDFTGEGCDTYVGIACRRSMDIAAVRYAATDAPKEGAPLPLFPHFAGGGSAEASVILSTLPATLVAAVTDHVVVSIFIPESPERTRVRRRFRFVGDAATDAAHAAARRRMRDAWAVVTDQDGPIIERMQLQAPLRDEVGTRPRFSPYWEPAVHHFQKVIAARLTEAA